ncbi:shikimate 5-dehydrogenase [Novosphingobium sp. KACC 22771]|uniref:shikimate 5-dehydrogenase n=1 Tax=Novosphingobium sp. KACC 22771 TaxID=3025670 RepID=UPI00236581FE|nr:shikimate 5-dehydrogenase [Novosphingobium sp. KACC 22771]WDF74451.1 shikimate 5-dehydrogenase [Novosphingobium sp. KACC 22771]
MPTKPPIGRDTQLCMSLSGRPGNAGSRLHNRLYEILGLDYVYKSFSTRDLPAAIGGIRALGIRGCAISMPFKEDVIPLLDTIEPSAAAIDSVNTIVNDDGVLSGHNTDYTAVRDLVAARGLDPAMPFLLRGSGGMAKAVAAALRDGGFAHGTIIARNAQAGQALAAQYGYGWRADLPESGAALLVNVTPLGMEGADAEALAYPLNFIADCQVAFDVVAQPARTPFIRAADDAGKTIISGAEVIVLQAVEQFVLYTGIRPDAAAIADAAGFAHGPQVGALMSAMAQRKEQ